MSSRFSDHDVPSVSVVIPAYNAECYIASAIRSVQAQTVSNFEVIVVDDASTDNTASIVREFSGVDIRIRYALMAKNSGPAASRNYGLTLAQGEWIALLDADDQFNPFRIETLLSLGRCADAEIVSDNVLLCTGTDDAGRRMISKEILSQRRLLTFTEFMEGCHHDVNKPKRVSYVFMHPMIKRDFLIKNNISYNERCRNGEDFLFYVDCFLANGKWFLTPEPMYVYSVRDGSLTDFASREDRRQMVNKLRTMLHDPQILCNARLFTAIKNYWKIVASDLYYWSFKDAFRAADYQAALRILSLDRAAPRLVLHEILRRGSKSFWRRVRSFRVTI